MARFDKLLPNIAIDIIFNEKLEGTLVKNGLGVHNVECNINKHALKSIRRAGIHEPKLIRQNKTSSYGLNHGWL